MPKKFDQDAKDRVVRLVEGRVFAGNLSLQKACQVFALSLGVSWHAARQWVQRCRREGRVHRLEEDVNCPGFCSYSLLRGLRHG